MYKHTVYCLNHEYEVETKGEATTYHHENMVYIQDEDGEEVFAINRDRLEAIALNNEVEQAAGLVYNLADAATYIVDRLHEANKTLTRNQVDEVLELEEDYMRSVGIIED